MIEIKSWYLERIEKGSGGSRSKCGVTESMNDKARLPEVVKASFKSEQTNTSYPEKKTE